MSTQIVRKSCQNLVIISLSLCINTCYYYVVINQVTTIQYTQFSFLLLKVPFLSVFLSSVKNNCKLRYEPKWIQTTNESMMSQIDSPTLA